MADNLKLQVILSALDKASGPLKRISGGSIGAAKALKEARDNLKQLNATQKDVSAWRTQRTAAAQTEKALGAARQRIKDLGQQMAATGVPTKALSRDMKAAVRDATRLKQEHSQQQVALQGLRNKLTAAGISTKNLSQGERDLRAKIAATNAAMSQQEDRLKRVTAQQKRFSAARSQYDKAQSLAGNMAGAGAGAAAAGTAMGLPVLATVKNYMAFETSMLGVAKQMDGARDDNGKLTATYYRMGDSIKDMSERIPLVTTELAALIEGAARMGIQGEKDLLRFAEVASSAGTAFEIPADEIGENLARIANLYKLPIANIDKLGDVINYLDDNAQSKGADIIEVMTRLSDVADKLDYKTAAALGSTFLTMGRQAETAASASRAMVRELGVASMQSKKFQVGMKMIGLDSDVIQKRMSTDAMGTIIEVLEKIKGLEASKQQEAATRLFGKEYGKDAAALTHNLDELRRQLDLVNAAKAQGSMQREAEIRAESIEARLLMAQNRAFNLSATLGGTLRPTLLELFESFNKVVSSVAAWVKANPELAGQILKTVAGVAGLAIVFGTVTLALASFLGPFAMVRYGMMLFGIKSLGMISAIKGIGTAVIWIGRALLTTPIGWFLGAIALIAGAAYLIYKNWEPIKAFFLNLWAEIKERFSGGLGGIAALILSFSPLGLFHNAFAAVMGYFGIELPGKFTEFGAMLMQGLVSGITSGLAVAKEAITGAGSAVIGWFKEKLGIRSPSRVFAQLGGFTMAGLAQGLMGGEGTVLKQIGATADRVIGAGGDMLGGVSIDRRAPLSARGAAATSTGGNTYNFVINAAPGMDPAAIGREVQRQLAAVERQQQARGRARLGDQE